ncbi:low affinity iron permease family protein [Pseudomonas ovata]|uniref:low affinity iron permease family protein n=1 Tax=Pseudomonas ovata TaxID=1839709 RepID=UPI000D68E5E1|nr:low affinity iron permease family protein [Pseudomonas ovata]
MKFAQIAQAISKKTGSPTAFLVALLLIMVWAATGPWFHYNDTWQLIINTSTTIITFLMVFIIQNTQNRDNDILHIKIDELLRATNQAHRAVLDLDSKDSKQLKQLRRQYRKLASGEEIEILEQETVVKDEVAAQGPRDKTQPAS